MKVVIIGNGIAGITAARYIRKNSNFEITAISEETQYPFSRTALMYVFMGHLPFENTKLYEDYFWEKNRIELKLDYVQSVDFQKKTLHLKSGSNFNYDKLILATGSKPNFGKWANLNLSGVLGLYHKQDLEKLEAYSHKAKKAVVIGGGLIGIEAVEMLHSRGIEVSFLVREESYWSAVLPKEESEMVNRHILEHHVDLQLSTEVESILGDGKVQKVITVDGREFEADLIVVSIGVQPNIDFVRNTNLELNKGILVNEYLETSIQDVYAIGDCCELKTIGENRRAIEAVWYTAKAMGEAVAQTICGSPKRYQQGIWFNSAKFFDLEFQTYGYVPTQLPDGMKTVLWQHPAKNKLIRIDYLSKNQSVVGFNVLGIRYRHQVCESWIKNKTPIETVLKELHLANFDPEFSERYETELLRVYNQTV